MAPDIPKIDPDGHPNLGDAAWNFRDEVLRWFFHGHSLSDSKDLLIPFFDNFGGEVPQNLPWEVHTAGIESFPKRSP